MSIYPRSEEQYEAMIAANVAFAGSCIDLSGSLVNNVDTLSFVHDIEVIRTALGSDPLNWLGVSYGTVLGLDYAEAFPANIRALVLDSVVDHSHGGTSGLAANAYAFEAAFDRFLEMV